MSEHSDLISQFRDVTGIEEERARFYLECAAWQLDIALANFFESDGTSERQMGDGEDEPVEVLPSTASRDVAGRQSTQDTSKSRNVLAHKIVEANSSDSEEEGQAFYVGGSETSGQQVLGPARHKAKNSDDIVGEMFKSAKEHGAEVLERGATKETTKKKPFQGAGYRLGQSEDDVQVIPGAREPNPPKNITLKLWKTGFSVDEGPLRDYQDPVNREFLESIKRGEIPIELIRESRGREVHLQMESHQTEEFISKKSRFQAFAGQGQVLGSPAPIVTNTTVSSSDTSANEQKAKSELRFNESEPSTSIQIRMADGSRLVGRFNHTHTVGQLRQYIITCRPQYAATPFVLLTSFPKRELTDDHVTLKDASLLNETIMQRLK